MENEKFSAVPSLTFLFAAGRKESKEAIVTPLSTVRISGFSHNVKEPSLIIVEDMILANVCVFYDDTKIPSKGEDPWIAPIDIVKVTDGMVEAVISAETSEAKRTKQIMTPANRITLRLSYTGIVPKGIKRDNPFLVLVNLKYEPVENDGDVFPSMRSV
jgi:hypothetical protein